MLNKTKWLVKEAKLRVRYMVSGNCIFCKIVNGEVKKEFLAQTQKTVAFDDINPVADVHVLIVPKRHIESTSTMKLQDGEDVVDLFKMATELALQKKLDAYRLTFNAGRFQHVPHLHMHLLSGSKINWTKL